MYQCCQFNALLTALTQTNFNSVIFFNGQLTFFWLDKCCRFFTCCLETSHVRKNYNTIPHLATPETKQQARRTNLLGRARIRSG